MIPAGLLIPWLRGLLEPSRQKAQEDLSDPNVPVERKVGGGFSKYSVTLPPLTPPPLPSTPPEPEVVASIESSTVRRALRDMQRLFDMHHIKHFRPAEACRLPKAKGGYIAIPPLEMWPHMVRTLRLLEEIRPTLGPIMIRGYRPPAYNRAVGGAKKSRHQFFQAVDCRVQKSKRRTLCLEAARLWIRRGEELDMGLGVYGPASSPSHIHLDTGHRRRFWGSALPFIKEAKREA